MIYGIFIILSLISIIYLSKIIKSRSQFFFIIIAGIILFLVATGRAHWLSAIFVALLPIVKKLFLILRYLPILQRFTSKRANSSNVHKQNQMSKAEAAKILGINENSTNEEIISAHKKQMQKYHPDKGGSKEMAAKINRAKETLIN